MTEILNHSTLMVRWYRMKKVAIITWYHYPNFGTALQVTALSYIVEKMGYQPEVIQYIPHGKLFTRGIYKRPSFLYKKIINKVNNRNVIRDESCNVAFSNFLNKHIKLTRPCRTASELFTLNSEFDAFICGSDQIWAPTVFNSKYFLDFVQQSSKMISYAPSIGLSVIEDMYVRNRMREHISRFNHLSIREEQGRNLIKELCGKEAIVVLDPTLLLTPDEWDFMASNQVESSPYMLCYFLGANKRPWEYVEILSKKTGLSVKVIPIFKQDLRRGYQVISGMGPAEFLGLIKNAALVCTDSFHGTVFSILYERPFFTFERFSNKDSNSQNSRIYNILKIVGLEDRLIKGKAEIRNNPFNCDFTEPKRRLEIEKKKSLQFLENALKESTESASVTIDAIYSITNTCCGCGTCTAICKEDAVEIRRDKDGFLKAFIIQNKCIRCGMCKKVCPFNGMNSTEINKEKHKLFMAYSKSAEVLQTSSSGGIGYELSKILCEQGYDVIGCTYDKEKAEAIHQCSPAGKVDKLHVFQGSKYLQSSTADVIKKLTIKSEKAVVFGTPCQIAGTDRLLKLKEKRNNFILVDLICHGVPSQNLWKKYIKEGSEKYGYGLTPEVVFRYKPKGWRKMYIRLFGNGKVYLRAEKKDLFYRFFLVGHCFAPSCYECNYRTASAADIRIGDYWGPRYKNNKKGVSMVIAMTSVGEEILQHLYRMNRIELKQMNCEEYWTVQYPQNPVKPVFYEELMAELKDDLIPLRVIADKYCREYEYFKKIYLIYNLIKKFIKQ